MDGYRKHSVKFAEETKLEGLFYVTSNSKHYALYTPLYYPAKLKTETASKLKQVDSCPALALQLWFMDLHWHHLDQCKQYISLIFFSCFKCIVSTHLLAAILRPRFKLYSAAKNPYIIEVGDTVVKTYEISVGDKDSKHKLHKSSFNWNFPKFQVLKEHFLQRDQS